MTSNLGPNRSLISILVSSLITLFCEGGSESLGCACACVRVRVRVRVRPCAYAIIGVLVKRI